MPKQNSLTKVVLTGGHAATTALATLEEITQRQLPYEIFWIGAETAFEGKKIPTLESRVFSERGVRFFPIVAGRLHKRLTKWSLISLFKIPLGFLHAFYHLVRIRPKIVLSFGGFAAYPVVVSAWLMRIPVILHEQTSVAGRANKYSSLFATKVAVSRESSREFFPAKKVILTGNPVMSRMWNVKIKKSPNTPPSIFVTGGSRGSQTINGLIGRRLLTLLSKYTIVHQTGEIDFVQFRKVKDELPKELQGRYEVYATIDPGKMDGVYSKSDIVVARAGANTVSEIMAIKRPSILIPIPWTAHDEQTKNAQSAHKFGIALVLNQETITPEELEEKIDFLVSDFKNIVAKVSTNESPDKDASKKLVDLIVQCLN